MAKKTANDRIPLHLSPTSQQLWLAVVPRRGTTAEFRALLWEALTARDRAEQAREQLARDGLIVNSGTGTPHANPLCRIEKDARQQFLSAWRALDLARDPEIDGVEGWTEEQ